MDPSELLIYALFILLGLFAIIASLLNLEWFFKTSGAMMFVNWLGVKGARVFYSFLGLVLIACGMLGFMA